MTYFIITPQQAASWNGLKDGPNQFFAREITSGTHAGKFACSENAIDEFYDLFPGQSVIIDELTASNFPTPQPLH